MKLLPVLAHHKKQYDISLIRSCKIVKTFVIYEKRWQWARGLGSAEHDFETSHHHNLFIACEDTVLRHVEKLRTRGSSFSILECPAILLELEQYSLVITFKRRLNGLMADSLLMKDLPLSLKSLLTQSDNERLIIKRILEKKLSEESTLSDISLLRRYCPSPSGFKNQLNWVIDFDKINVDFFHANFEAAKTELLK
jgi:hypothetical protein